MPSDELPLRFQDDLQLVDSLALERPALRAHQQCVAGESRPQRDAVWPLLEQTYGAEDAQRWFMRWRVFFMACAELFGYDEGEQWWVSHYLFERPHTQVRERRRHARRC